MSLKFYIPSLLLSASLSASPLDDKVDFAREVLPVLSDKCFVCHGPDPLKEDLLRLDSRDGATRDLGGYRAINPDDLAQSEILSRIHDKEDPMPPADAEKQLTPAERELLGRWVRQGGEYAKHWAFVPPKRTTPTAKAGSVIDAFIADGLQERGVEFAPEAEPATLARRAALILTGLPPELEQLDAYLADVKAGKSDAYDKLVEQLLATTRYGEHQARYWLDAVRYGDTHGLHLDNRRAIYPYRDWVVRAMNENMPLDRFITWQLAGDMLPNPTMAQRVATGYVRMNLTTSEGGVLAEEFQAKNNFDRTETLGTVFLGMTLTCARCHNHKYDPISQEEYYRLLAFFNSTSERSLDGNSYTYGPILEAPRDQAAWTDWTELENQQNQLMETGGALFQANRDAILDYAKARADWSVNEWRTTEALDETAPPPLSKDWKEIKGLPGNKKEKLPKEGQAIWVSFNVNVPANQLLWLTHSGNPKSRVLVDHTPIPEADRIRTGDRSTEWLLALSKGSHEIRIQMRGPKAETSIEVQLREPWKALAKAGSWNGCNLGDRLLMLTDPEGPFAHLDLAGASRKLSRDLEGIKTRLTPTLVARDLDKPRPTRILRRGEYNLPTGDPLQPDTPGIMGALPEGAPRNRLGLAGWLTSRDNPVVSRVLVNRIWQRVFGDALVRSPEDFGLQGQQPTHPELLDWLAVELMESGWDLKHMLRLMVTSRTFRQSSAWRSEVDDPENRWFARGPGFRLDAEVLRDLGLWSSNLLDPVMGGEGVKPYQPDGMWFAMAHPASNTKRYERDKGKRLYRRSLYVYWKRTSPHPMMTLFDAPSRESSCVQRSRTSTSLQSLGLLNETQRIEMARMLGERLMRGGEADAQRFKLLFRLLASREPTPKEQDACASLLKSMRERYRAAPKDADALLGIGDAARDEKLDPVELAAWSQVAVTVLASDIALLLY